MYTTKFRRFSNTRRANLKSYSECKPQKVSLIFKFQTRGHRVSLVIVQTTKLRRSLIARRANHKKVLQFFKRSRKTHKVWQIFKSQNVLKKCIEGATSPIFSSQNLLCLSFSTKSEGLCREKEMHL